RAALGGLWHDASPPTLEGRARHHTVLEGEEGQEAQVDDDGTRDRALGRRVDRTRHAKAADEPDCIEERCEETSVREDSIDEHSDPVHDSISFPCSPPASSYRSRGCHTGGRPSCFGRSPTRAWVKPSPPSDV